MRLSAGELKEIEDQKRQNFKERLEFVKWYAEWVRRTPNKVWSKQQKDVIG